MAGRLGRLAAFRLHLLLFLFLGGEVPLGGTGPVVDIEIPSVLSREWDNRDRRHKSHQLAWRLSAGTAPWGTIGAVMLDWTATSAVQKGRIRKGTL